MSKTRRGNRRGRSGRRTGRSGALETLEQRCLLAGDWWNAGWTIEGDANPRRPEDVIVVSRSPQDAGLLQAVVNGRVVDTRRAADVSVIRVLAGLGDDRVLIDLGKDDGGIRVFVWGGRGADLIIGGVEVDRIRGGPGKDTVKGGGQDDDIGGGPAADLLDGQGGDDFISGGTGADILQGSWGANRLIGGDGQDWIYGRRGADRFQLKGRDTLLTGAGALDSDSTPAQVKQWLIDSAVEQWKDLFGKTSGGYHYRYPLFTDFGSGGGVRVMADEAGNQYYSAAPDHSDTNTQEQGVDEGDFVKTNGDYIYLLSDDQLLILDSWPADQLDKVGAVDLEGNPLAMYLDGDRVTVISQVYDYSDWPWMDDAPVGVDRMMLWRPYYSPQLNVTVFDVSDPTDVVTLESTTLDGYLIDSRQVGDRLYLVVENNLVLPGPVMLYDQADDTYTYESEQDYRDRLEEVIEDEIPQYTTTADGEEVESGLLIDGPELYTPDDPYGQDVVSVLLLKPGDDEPGVTAWTSVLGVSGTVYASTDSLYLVSTDWSNYYGDGYVEMSDITKFRLGANNVMVEATGAVPGWALNQFSMDEEDGYFRIATTNWGEMSNNVFVLGQEAHLLNIVGRATGLGKGETIYSARFLGDRGYVTTFRQVDPLFCLDMSDPFYPRVVGELEIPGYSSYLHPLDENHLIGFGRDADPKTGLVQGLQVSLFDVSDMADPVRTDLYKFSGDAWQYSAAEYDHHAFSYFADRGILAVPVDEGWWNGVGGSLRVFHVTAADGIDYLGQIDHDDYVSRSLRIGEFLYSISYSTIKVNKLDAGLTEVAQYHIARPYDPYRGGVIVSLAQTNRSI